MTENRGMGILIMLGFMIGGYVLAWSVNGITGFDQVNSNELHWNHRDISYQIKGCNPNEQERINNAFGLIRSSSNNSLNFTLDYTKDKADIMLYCTPDISKETEDSAGDSEYIYSGNVIKSSVITFYTIQGEYGHAGSCVGSYPVTEIHEILHSLGFTHKNNLNSIMNPFETCVGNIDMDIQENLTRIYQS